MSVPLPPILTDRGSELIRGDPLHWAIFRSEWTALVFCRRCVDLCYRGVMWKVRPRLRDWIGKMGVEALLKGSGFDVPLIRRALAKHVSLEWANCVKGPNTLGVVSTHSGYSPVFSSMRGVLFGTLNTFYFQQNTSPYISHDTDTMMTHYDTGGTEIP
jgi:hypothetical protein